MNIKDSIETRLLKMLEKKYGKAKKPEPQKEKVDTKSVDKKCQDDSRLSDPDSSTSSQTAASLPAVGHMSTDKAVLLATEFDLLFNVKKETAKC